GCSTRRSAPRRDEHPGACCARPGGARDRRACVARRLPRAHARDVWQRHVRGGVRLVVRPQPGGAAHRQRGARRGRDAARRARDELLSDVPGPCRLRRARGDDAGRARPKRLRRTGRGGFRVEPSCPAFEPRHEARFDAHHILRDAAYLTWRYADSPRLYHRVESDGGWAVVTHSVWHGFSAAVVCEAVGAGLPSLLRRCVRAVDADLAVAMVNPGEERAYLAAGFAPTPRSIRFIGKRLTDDAPPLPKERRAWRFSLGDLDFF